VIQKLEESGLRKEFWIYGYEEYTPFYYHQILIDSIKKTSPDTSLAIDSNKLRELYNNSDLEIIPIMNSTDSVEGMTYKEWSDSSLSFNRNGKFIYALEKFSNNDSTIIEYLDAKEAVGNISPSLISSGLLASISNPSEPFVKKIILLEIYYWMIGFE
jgi:hypothetical protein